MFTTSRAISLWQIVADTNFFGKKLKRQTMKKKTQNIKHKIYQKVMNRLINHCWLYVYFFAFIKYFRSNFTKNMTIFSNLEYISLI